jgi:hypothetical protein
LLFAQGDAAELGQHDRMLPRLFLPQREHPASRSLALEQERFDIADAVPPP